MKLKGALLLVVAATVCALTGLISPQEAAASVDVVNQWPAKPTIVSNTAGGTITGIYTPGAGTNRVMLVAVATEYSVAGTPVLAVTYGGQVVTLIPSASNTAQNNKIWLGYLLETGIATGSAGTKILQVVNSGTGTVAATYVTVAVYGGASQVAPTGLAAATASATSLATGAYAVTGSAANMGMSVYVANWNGQTSTAAGTPAHTEIRDYAGTNFNLASGYAVVTTGTTTSNPSTSVGVAAIGAIAGAGLAAVTNAGTNYATVTTCGDCHGYPPQDGTYVTARNNPPGQFQGAHSKHAGKDEGQYGYACTVCHYNAADTRHSTGFKNISGSKVPRNTYGGQTNIASTNNPSFQTCTKSTCHSTGRATLQYSASPAWNGTTTCLSCHGGRSNTTNLYAKTTTTNFSLSTTHSQHLGKYPVANMNCNHCHGKVAKDHTALKDYTGAIYHGNGTKNVIFNDIAYASYTSYKKTGLDAGKCTNTACHGGKSRSAWANATAVNTDNTCAHCHGVAGTSAGLANSGANRRFFAPGYKVAANIGTSTDQINSTNNIRVGSHFKHLSSVYMKAIKCNECHRVPATVFDGSHAASTRFNSQTLTFLQSSSASITIGVASPGLPARNAALVRYSSGTSTYRASCVTTYCHGSRLKTADTSGSYNVPYWNYSAMINYTNPNQACGRCHGNPPRTGSSQATHKNYTAVGKPTVTCSACHGSVVDATGKIINRDLHINGVVNAANGHEWSFGGIRHKNGGTGSLTANPNGYSNCTGCHSLTGGGSYPVTRGVAANINCAICHTNTTNLTNTPGCGDCHGLNATGVPDGAANAFPNWSGSHTAHVGAPYSYTCNDCHANGGTGKTTHGNYSGKAAKTRATVNVGFNTVKAGDAAAYTAGTMTCSTSQCHGQKSPAWGQVMPTGGKCYYCHGSQSSAFTNVTSATIAPGTANFDTNRATGVTVRGGLHQEHMNATMGIADKVRCSDCHVKVNAVSDVNHLNYTTARVTFGGHATKTDWATYTPSVTRTNGIITCNNTACHAGKTGTGAAAPVWNNAAYLSGTNSGSTLTVADCQKCHAFPPTPGSGDHVGLATVTGFPLNSQCGGNCHNLVTNATTFGTIFADKSLHMNGKLEGGDCISCHSAVKGNRAAVVGQFASQSHHIQGTEALTKASCYKCHWEATITGDINAAYHSQAVGKGVSLVVWGPTDTIRPATVTAATLISYTANGSRDQIKKLNAVCLGCHNSTVRTGANLFGVYATDQYSPEPKMVPAMAKTSILSRYSSSRTVAWSLYNNTMQDGNVTDYGTNRKNSTTKALSAHGNAIKNQFPSFDQALNGTGEDQIMADVASATLSSNRNVFCYDCHNSHGSNATGITSSYSSATGRYKGGLLKSTIANQGGYSVTYTPAARTISYKSYSTTARHAATFNPGASICNDCHNNDTRKVNIARPWSITSTYSSSKAIVGYWSTPYFDNYTVYPAKRTAYKAGGPTINSIKDLRKPMGGHYGSSANLGNYSGVSHSGNINGLCTPCHDPHGISSSMSVTNRGKSVPLLKGTWVTSPYREDKATPTVIRGGGSDGPNFGLQGAMPGYNIDQNTLVTLPAPVNGGGGTTTLEANKRQQRFVTFPGGAGYALTLHTEKTPADFAGLCIGCHAQGTLTNATAPAAGNWMSKERVHQSVAGWAATTGSNANGTVHAYTCSKCHTPHVSRLPRLLTTNCLDVRHVRRSVAGGSIATTANGTVNFGNIRNTAWIASSSVAGAGRFPGGGGNYMGGTLATIQNPGPWYFLTALPTSFTATADSSATATTYNYGSGCHNAATAGGTAYNPATQIWNKKSRW